MNYASARFVFFLSLGAMISGCVQTLKETRTEVTSGPTPTVREIQAIPYTGPRIRIAVTRFENKAGAQGQTDIGNGMSEQLVSALLKSGKFIVLERQGLDDVIREQDISMTGRMNLETAPALARLEGAEFVILGAVTGFTSNVKGGGASIAKDGAIGLGGGGGNVLGGNVGISGNYQEAYVTMDLRIVDTTTGRVVNATTIDGTPASAGGGVGISFSGVAFGIQGFYNTPMGQAVRACIEKAVDWIAGNAFAEKGKFSTLVPPVAAPQASAPPAAIEQTALKKEIPQPVITGSLTLSMNIIGQRKEGNGSYTEVLVNEGSVLRSYDNFQVHLETNRPAYVHILIYDSQGRARQLFPDAKIDQSEFIKPGRNVVIPRRDLWFWLDQQTGTETIYVVASETPMSDIQGLLAKMANVDEAGQKRVSQEIKQRIAMVQRGVGGITKGQAVTYKLSDGKKIQKVTDVVTGTGSVVRAVSFQHR